MSEFRRHLATLSLCAALLACRGPEGPRGSAGEAGESGEAGASGEQGPPGERGPAGEVSITEAGVVEPGLEPDGLVGQVTDPTRIAVTRGRVVLVPATDVAALAQRSIDLAELPTDAARATHDEPIEDLLDASDAYAGAELDARGVYRFSSVDDGEYFVAFVPAEDDAGHAPGGDRARVASAAESLRGTRLDLRVSGLPSEQATYVGSTPCLTCHGRHASLQSAHALTLRAPGQSTQLQDASQAPQLDEVLDAFIDGQTLYFSECDVSGVAQPPCVVDVMPPADLSTLALRLVLEATEAQDTGRPIQARVRLESADGAVSRAYPVELTVGGALSYQQYLTRLRTPDGGSALYALPFTYQRFGKRDLPEARDQPFVAYAPSQWLDLTTLALREPDPGDAFDRQCAGCHVTGAELRGSARSGFHVSMAPESDGLDYDGDGRRDLSAVGCEACHGPGSEHLEATVAGAFIVSPQLLTPGRATLVCGRCHSNPRGASGQWVPLDADGRQARAGVRRRDYIDTHTARIDAAASDLFTSGDSRHTRQQYTDFIRSPKYRNGRYLMSCADCHDSHREAGIAADLHWPAKDNGGCVECHGERRYADVRDHVERVTTDPHVLLSDAELACTACHMVETARGGAGILALTDDVPRDASTVQYYHGDRASHRFAYVGPEQAAVQPVAATDRCGLCHRDTLPNP